jgi:hypothetical protein
LVSLRLYSCLLRVWPSGKAVDFGSSLLLPASIVAVVLVILDGFLFDITAIVKLLVVSILFFWTYGQERIEFLEFPCDAWAGLILFSHIVVSNKVAVKSLFIPVFIC